MVSSVACPSKAGIKDYTTRRLMVAEEICIVAELITGKVQRQSAIAMATITGLAI